MDSKRLFILLILLLLVICVLVDQGEAFALRPPRKRKRRCFIRLKRCSKRRSRRGKKADVIKLSHVKDVSAILVGHQFYKFQNLSKIITCASKVSVRVRTEKENNNKIFRRNNFRTFSFFSYIYIFTWTNDRC